MRRQSATLPTSSATEYFAAGDAADAAARSTVRVLGRPVNEDWSRCLWVLHGAETYLDLVRDSGQSPEEYDALLGEASKRLAGLFW
jgi:hypothetical protein